ncbi:MAG: hypothetical protein MZV65_20710 [Chromatiales bacterium]|nr:hypothetical protein [Chromatiales bacterium]
MPTSKETLVRVEDFLEDHRQRLAGQQAVLLAALLLGLERRRSGRRARRAPSS